VNVQSGEERIIADRLDEILVEENLPTHGNR
jgi:hypothetical protein